MAKQINKRIRSITFKNAVIDCENMKITEVIKDDLKESDLVDILKSWDGIEGITLIIKLDDDISPTTEEGE